MQGYFYGWHGFSIKNLSRFDRLTATMEVTEPRVGAKAVILSAAASKRCCLGTWLTWTLAPLAALLGGEVPAGRWR